MTFKEKEMTSSYRPKEIIWLANNVVISFTFFWLIWNMKYITNLWIHQITENLYFYIFSKICNLLRYLNLSIIPNHISIIQNIIIYCNIYCYLFWLFIAWTFFSFFWWLLLLGEMKWRFRKAWIIWGIIGVRALH